MQNKSPKVSYAQDDLMVAELRQRVDSYFSTSKFPRRGDLPLAVKTTILFFSWWTLYFVLLLVEHSMVSLIALIAIGAIVTTSMTVMSHNALHGMHNGSPLARFLAISMAPVLGYDIQWWILKHNRVHHRYVNIYGFDDDIHLGLIRFAKQAPWRAWHRYQSYYVWLIYPFTYLGIVLIGGPRFLWNRKLGHHFYGKTTVSTLLSSLGQKLVFIGTMVVVPSLFYDLWQVVTVFLVWSLMVGLIISVLLICSHMVDKAIHHEPDRKLNIQVSWYESAISGSVDVGAQNPILTWLFSGISLHTAHHLFPTVSITHYPAITRIIQTFCADKNIPYISYPGYIRALIAHTRVVKARGASALSPTPV